jgi:hypothetical protein
MCTARAWDACKIFFTAKLITPVQTHQRRSLKNMGENRKRNLHELDLLLLLLLLLLLTCSHALPSFYSSLHGRCGSC